MSYPHEVRPYDAARDEDFVFSSWVSGTGEKRDQMEYLLRRPDVKVRVAYLEGNPDDLVGWAAERAGQLVWVYVRSSPGVRRRGLARSLLAHLGLQAPIRCLYWARSMPGLFVAEKLGFVYAPHPQNRRKISA